MISTACPDPREAERAVGLRSPGCPFLGHAADERRAPTHDLVCSLREGAQRVPSRDDLAWFCTSGCHHGCPTYRRYREECHG